MSACPSRIEISRWEAEPACERPADFTSHVAGCARCAAVLEDIGSARSFLLGADPEQASARAARAIVERARQRRDKRRWLRILAPAFLVPAAAALLFATKPALFLAGQGEHGSTGVKGGLVLETYCKRGEQVLPAVDGQDFLAGDRLRFAYTCARPGYLLVFGVDDQGRIFPYYEEGVLAGVFAEAGARVLLPGSVELDGHRGWERVYALWSETQFRDDVVRAAVAAGLAAAGNDIRRVTTLDLPVEQVSMLLRRP
ncbi:MAG: DUF4384 domain-containing protein [Deltaproteobacteria bacterium]|nr:DUF4384 domain-containing protein [Deltaproteobacteria bacterium]